jgi:hypothetical protein
MMLYGQAPLAGFAALCRRTGWRRSARALAIGLLTFMAVTALTRMMIRAAIRGVRNLLT